MDESSTPTTVAAVAVADQHESKDLSAQPSGQNSLSASSPTVRRLTDAALSFLSNASNETLGACAIGLCATTYLALGRVGLVLIGTVAGVVLHATWEGSHDGGDGNQGASQRPLREEKSLGSKSLKGFSIGRTREKVWNKRRKRKVSKLKLRLQLRSWTFRTSSQKREER